VRSRLAFWTVTVISLLSIELMWLSFPAWSPWRWSPWYAGYLLPMAGCGLAAVLSGKAVSYRSRWVSGLLQAVCFLTVFSDMDVGMREPVEVLRAWVLWVIVYSITFMLVTDTISGLLVRRKRAHDAGERRCRNCGYLLLGLPTNRCPECGTVFGPGLLSEAGPQGDGTDSQY
jgi:hypothetical protein